MANSLSHITNRIFSGDSDPSQGTSPTAGPSAPSVSPDDPPKRKRGRPKTKKSGDSADGPKFKRPVGRPRKDGLPAGSVPKPAKRPKLESGETFPPWGSGTVLRGVGYPIAPPPGAVAQVVYGPLESKFALDEWAQLAHESPQELLSTLLNALAAPNPTSAMGPTIEEAFKIHLQSLTTNTNAQHSHNIPSLYSILKTFWLPSSPAYFTMAASTSTTRMPMEYRFLYWDPQPLVFNGIQCPYCPNYLSNNGRIRSGPIKIYDLDKPFFVIGCEYVCNSGQCTTTTSPEGRKFSSTDASIMNSLPKGLKDEFPARLLYEDTDAGSGPTIWNWSAMGVSTALWNLVIGGLNLGLRQHTILQLVHAIHFGAPEMKFELKSEERNASVPVKPRASTEEGVEDRHPTDGDDAENEIPQNADECGDRSHSVAVQNSWSTEESIRADSGSHSSPPFGGTSGPAPSSDLMSASGAPMTASHGSEFPRRPQPARGSPAFANFTYSQYAYYHAQATPGSSSAGGSVVQAPRQSGSTTPLPR
ncbi:hypothetical protein APHAL10511_000820 [Amanita phalloides]|nr:hypothetical protein APHAL10511_000820 [Amanita phalloides]